MESNRSNMVRSALKIFLALSAGAVVPALVVVLLYAVSDVAVMRAEGSLSSDLGVVLRSQVSSASIVFLFALAFTASHAFIFGIPLVLLGIRLRAIHWWSCIPVAPLIGIIPSTVLAGWDFISSQPIGAVLFAGLGAIGGLTFWLVWHFWDRRTPATSTAAPVADLAPASQPPAEG